jgi:hypothetical protein
MNSRRIAMLKALSIGAALFAACGSSPTAAQQWEAALKRVEVPGTTFDLVLAVPKSPPRALPDLSESPDALIVHLIGGELVLNFEDALEMMKAAQSLGSPIATSRVAGKVPEIGVPFAVYAVRKLE